MEKSIILPYMDSINNATVGLKITNSGEVQIRSSIVGYSSLEIRLKSKLRYNNTKMDDG